MKHRRGLCPPPARQPGGLLPPCNTEREREGVCPPLSTGAAGGGPGRRRAQQRRREGRPRLPSTRSGRRRLSGPPASPIRGREGRLRLPSTDRGRRRRSWPPACSTEREREGSEGEKRGGSAPPLHSAQGARGPLAAPKAAGVVPAAVSSATAPEREEGGGGLAGLAEERKEKRERKKKRKRKRKKRKKRKRGFIY